MYFSLMESTTQNKPWFSIKLFHTSYIFSKILLQYLTHLCVGSQMFWWIKLKIFKSLPVNSVAMLRVKHMLDFPLNSQNSVLESSSIPGVHLPRSFSSCFVGKWPFDHGMYLAEFVCWGKCHLKITNKMFRQELCQVYWIS